MSLISSPASAPATGTAIRPADAVSSRMAELFARQIEIFHAIAEQGPAILRQLAVVRIDGTPGAMNPPPTAATH